MRGESGQAMIETAVAVTVLAAILAALPCLLIYHDVQRTAMRTARDASYLAAWHAQGHAQLSRMLTDGVADLPWTHPRDGARVVAVEGADRLTASNEAPPGRAAAMLEFLAAPLSESPGYRTAAFQLSQQGFRRVQVELQVPALRGTPAPFSSLALALRGEAALLTDSWNSAGSRQVVERVSGLVPSHLVRAAAAPVRALSGVLQLIEPAYAQFCPGLIEAELLPESRFTTRSNAANARSGFVGPCR
jgi:hypothetical protein